jgi:phosphopantothenoylcysteine decarboxylase/phosphopantothenate--cysteine ligase
MIGSGRLAANETIVSAVMDALHATRELAGETVLISAGPTREPIDPVRYIGNRSSGKMGYALAEASLRMGAKVILVSGPTALKPPEPVEFIGVQTAEEMRTAVLSKLENASIVIKAAAVADYKPKQVAGQKIKRKGPVTLELEPTADIAAEIGKLRGRQLIIGFAAETENVIENARKKLNSKSLDAIVVNDVSTPGIGFDSEDNAVTILTADGEIEVPKASKQQIALEILKVVSSLKQRRSTPQKISR